MLKVWEAWSEIGIGDTIDNVVKSCQFKKDIVKCTKLILKVLEINLSQKEVLL